MAASWPGDEELFATARRELFVAVVGDALDRLGFQHQFLTPRVKPIDPGMVVLGRAMPVIEEDVANIAGPLKDKPFGLMFEALDDLRAGEVYLAAGGSPQYALWGGLMSTRAIACGAAGAVLNGYHRDTDEILRLSFPVASFGSYAQDQGPRGKVVGWRTAIEVDGVSVTPGDLVFGDRDGVVIVPQAVVPEIFTMALEKVRGETAVLQALQGGMTTVQAFAKFGFM